MSNASGLGVIGAASSVMAFIIGIGLITLPKLFARAGWIGGASILIGFACFLLFLVLKLSHAVLASGSREGKVKDSLRSIAIWSLGDVGGWALAACMYVEYTLFLSLLVLVLSLEIKNKILIASSLTLLQAVTIASAVFSPFCLVSNSKMLGYFSIFGLMGTIILSGLVISKGAMKAQVDPPGDTSLFRFDLEEWCLSAANVCLIYAASGIVPTIIGGMRQPSKFGKAATLVFILSTIFYLAIGMSGYAGWGSIVVQEDLLALLQDGSWSDIPTTVSLVLICIPQYAITALVINNGIDEAVPYKALHIPMRLTLLFLQALIAYGVDNLSGLLDVISAFTNVILVILFPVAIYWNLKRRSGKLRLTDHVFAVVSLGLGMVIIVSGGTNAINRLATTS